MHDLVCNMNDDTSSEADHESSVKFIRKLRKKLRQIERLGKVQRELTDEEKIKITCTQSIREKLQQLLLTINDCDVSIDSINENDWKEEISPGGGSGGAEKASEEPFNVKSTVKPRLPKTDDSTIPASKSIISVSERAPNLSGGEITGGKIEKVKKVQNQKSILRRHWRNSQFKVYELEGHNETVSVVDALDSWVVSGSRDTSLKLWDISNCTEICSMGGHTGQVTSVLLLSLEQSDSLRKNMDPATVDMFVNLDERESDDEKFVISGSTDCSVRIWLLPRGIYVKSLYNYNSVSALSYMPENSFLFVGSSSGNLTVYNLLTNCQIYSSTIHQNQITKLQCTHTHIYSSSTDGCISVWRMESGSTKTPEDNPRYCNLEFGVSSKDFNLSVVQRFRDQESFITDRQINQFVVQRNKIFFGDDGSNIKVWDLESGQVEKIRNHKPNVPGITDSICLLDNEDILLSSSYDIDQGVGSINVRTLHNECFGVYIASFCHPDIPRLLFLSSLFSNQAPCLITTGEKLLVWKFQGPGAKSYESENKKGVLTVKGKNVSELTKPATDSDVLTDGESSSTDDEGKWFWQWKQSKAEKSPSRNPSLEESEGENPEESDVSQELTTSSDTSQSYWNWCALI